MASDAMAIDPALSAQSSQALPRSDVRKTSQHSAAAADDDEDDDPIVATYRIIMKPSKKAQQDLKIIETPNQLDPNKERATPLELRTKPGTGMFEADFPLDHTGAYDRTKGLNWGTALQKSTEAKKGGSHGLAGGFGVGAPPPRAPRGGRGNDAIDYGMDWNEALKKDMVLRTQTLGGQTPDAGAESGYMVAVFAGGNLHLTSASSLIHLRPQPHHIDAAAEQEKNARGLNAAAGAPPAKEAARAIHMTIKQSAEGDDDDLVQETMADRLKKVQSEAWRKMRYVHDESAEAWAMSEQVLYADHTDKKEETTAVDESEASGHAVAGLVQKVAALGTGWREERMLETTSGIKNPEGVVKIEISDDDVLAAAPAAGKGKGKARAKSTTSATTGTKGKRATTTSTPKKDKASTAKAGSSSTAGPSATVDPSATTADPSAAARPSAKATPTTRAKKSKS